MSRSLYLFGIYLSILELSIILFYAIVYYQIGIAMFETDSFIQYYLVYFVLNTLLALLLIVYFFNKKFQFVFYAALFSLMTGIVNFVVVYTFMITQQFAEYLAPTSTIYELSGIPLGISLIILKAKERHWLKIAGVIGLIVSVLLLLFMMQSQMRPADVGTLQNAQQRVSIIGGLVLLFYGLNFYQELSQQSNKKTSTPLNLALGLISVMVFSSTLTVMVKMSREMPKMSFEYHRNKPEIAELLSQPVSTLKKGKDSQKTPVETYGHLQVDGNRILDSNGNAVQLRGMSLSWSQWFPTFYNYDAIKWLCEDWKIEVIRIAMAVDLGGFATNPEEELQKAITVADAAVDQGIYFILDFHLHDANLFLEESKTFFTVMAQRYGHLPNVIYEPWNEPKKHSWKKKIKPYHEEIIQTIRQYDEDNLIICGTSLWCKELGVASLDRIKDVNVAYTLHFYAGTAGHQESLRQNAQKALDNGIALFATEYGLSGVPQHNSINEEETRLWLNFLDENHISHCKWAVYDKPEECAVLIPGAPANGGWTAEQLTRSGHFARNEILAKNVQSEEY